MLKTFSVLSVLATFLVGVAAFELRVWTLGLVMFAVCYFNIRILLALEEMDDDHE